MHYTPLSSDPFLNYILEYSICILIGFLLRSIISASYYPETKNGALRISILLPLGLMIINVLIPILMDSPGTRFLVIGGIGWTVIGRIIYVGLKKNIILENKIYVENLLENGIIKERGNMFNNHPIGLWGFFDQENILLKEETYNNSGVLVKEEYFGDGSSISNKNIDHKIYGQKYQIEEEIENEDSDQINTYQPLLKINLYGKIINKMEKWISNLTKEQRIIFALAFPAMLFCIAYPLTQHIQHHYYRDESIIYDWGIWFIFIAIVAFFEFKIFGQKKNEEK